ncbi:MAG: hypothetical protein M1839_006281 [Geoglossum umbratile]|nr:MAG: hypothetical protein M1839_006281 [Geoglossum umbratile]
MERSGFPIPSGPSLGGLTTGGKDGKDGQQPLPSREEKIRRRNRTITSCLECRRRKQGCNKAHPCSHCRQHGRNCVYLSPALDFHGQSKLTEIKEQWGTLERMLERDIARVGHARQRDDPLPGNAEENIPAAEGEQDLEETPMAVLDAAYEDDADDDLFDLGIQMGRMRINERVGGLYRPMIAEELNRTLNDSRNDRRSDAEKSASPELPPLSVPSFHELLLPNSTYIAPGDSKNAPNYFFGGFDHSTSIMAYMTPRKTADRLKLQYFNCVHPLACIVHKPTFEAQYERFWDSIIMGIEPPYSLQALYFAVMFSATVSMSDEAILGEYGRTKESVVNDFRMNTEASLAKANFIRTTKLETLQAFVMYLIPLCRDQISRAHSALTATAIRIAECMGLHRDGEVFGRSPIETHIRRLVWYQLCFLDLRTCESQGPRPIIRKGDFDTKFPLNLDDSDFTAGPWPLESVDRWTDMTFSLIRFECNEMLRIMWVDRPRLEKKEITLLAVLSNIEKFKEGMEKKYSNNLNEEIPIQRAAKHVMVVLICRMYVMVLHRYFKPGQRGIQDRIRQVTVTNALCQIENAIALETDPALSQWAWYVGAWQQWHTALLMLTDIWSYPEREEADRVWLCLDYVFECDTNLSRDEKARRILMELRDKAGVLRSARKLKLPVALEAQRWRLGTSPYPSPYGGAPGSRVPSLSPALSNPPPIIKQSGMSLGSSGASDSPALMSPGLQILKDEPMIDIDWEEFDRMFSGKSTFMFEPINFNNLSAPAPEGGTE